LEINTHFRLFGKCLLTNPDSLVPLVPVLALDFPSLAHHLIRCCSYRAFTLPRQRAACAMPQCQQVEVKVVALGAQSAHVGEEKSKERRSNLLLVT
jgi:hypothetical protein